ncbi:MAG TPA: hypothetical protein VIC05_01575 [Solirubrobacteraceae bacterium]|jgi:hypothetical protein
MLSTEVKRTLVKSPPELWAELSDPARLEHHLGELGQIRITSTEPEKLIEWEADVASGKVQMKPSGWGTQVLLSVTRALPSDEPEPETIKLGVESEQEAEQSTVPEVEREVSAQPETPEAGEHEVPADECCEQPDQTEASPAGEEEAVADERSGPLSQDIQAQPEPEPEAPQPQSIPETPATQPRLGFFARLFRRRGGQSPPEPPADDAGGAAQPFALESEPAASEPPAAVDLEPPTAAAELERELAAVDEPVAAAEHEPASDESYAGEEGEPTLAGAQPTTQQEPAPDAAADLAALEAQMAEQDGQLLTAMLDRLGAAHHRPFSRG